MKFIEISCHNKILRGSVHCPKYNSIPYPIIIVHGYFSANRIGPQRLFVNLSNYLCEKGYSVYRFDLSGMGESDGDISNIKFNDHVKDLNTIINYVRRQHNYNKVIIIAHCLGCNITLNVVNTQPDAFREVIFLAPFYSNLIIMERFFGKEKLRELSSEKYTYRKGLYADYSFFIENTQENFITNINLTPITINVVIPEVDQFIPVECNNETFKHTEKAKLIWLENADHNFLETQHSLINTICELLDDEKYST